MPVNSVASEFPSRGTETRRFTRRRGRTVLYEAIPMIWQREIEWEIEGRDDEFPATGILFL